MKEFFGALPDGQQAYLYTISHGNLTAVVSDLGATLVRLLVPDQAGWVADVVLGFDSPKEYCASTTYFGATVGRNANRVKGAAFTLNGKVYTMPANEGANNLHSGPDGYSYRLWTVERHEADCITFRLESPSGDQGFPGKAVIRVTYRLDAHNALCISYDAVSDTDTIFNLTNHSYFNLAGHHQTGAAVQQLLTIPGRFFTPDDSENIPTGELRSVVGTPFDFRSPKPIGQDIQEDYDALNLQGGYDHNFEVFCNPCAILRDPTSGREMAVCTDCPGIQLYAGNYLNEQGKDGIFYSKHSGIALEAQYYPDAIHHPEWPQPVTKAGKKYHSETKYCFSW